jgi:hypothetical protein
MNIFEERIKGFEKSMVALGYDSAYAVVLYHIRIHTHGWCLLCLYTFQF